ncbi:hypothetical protein RIF29_20639 [Crotalaria pallida]|uniref:Uncharacterized protein n=1 Tax=Crotalaria pallida TaxID=3830 RepID=A0AAN9F5X5_CROPI
MLRFALRPPLSCNRGNPKIPFVFSSAATPFPYFFFFVLVPPSLSLSLAVFSLGRAPMPAPSSLLLSLSLATLSLSALYTAARAHRCSSHQSRVQTRRSSRIAAAKHHHHRHASLVHAIEAASLSLHRRSSLSPLCAAVVVVLSIVALLSLR